MEKSLIRKLWHHHVEKFFVSLFLLVIIIFLAFIGFVQLMNYYFPVEGTPLQDFRLNNFGIESYQNTTDSLTLQFDFQYSNLFNSGFTFNVENLIIQTQNNSAEPWQYVGQLSQSQSLRVNANANVTFSGVLNVSNTASNLAPLTFLGEIIGKSNFTVSFTASLTLIQKDNTTLPDQVPLSLIEPAQDAFNYSVPGLIPSVFTISDLHSPGINPNDPDQFWLEITGNYNNTFNFPIDFLAISGNLVNRTLGNQFGEINLNSSNFGLIPSGSYENFTLSCLIPIPQFGWTLSDILSNSSGIFNLENLNLLAQIDTVQIPFSINVQSISSSIQFPSQVTNYTSSGSDVYLDLTIFNPCDVILNFSYIVISVVIHNTNTQLMSV